MAFDTAAGASLAISATLAATYDAAGYGALTFTTVGEITAIGEFGKEFAVVTHNPLATRGTKKSKGSFNNGTLSPTMALDNTDAGQTLMKAALESDAPYAFRVTLDTGEIYYLEGIVPMFKPNVGTVDDVVTATATIDINENPIVFVAAP